MGYSIYCIFTEEFKAFFESYGELADWILMTDDITHSGRNRGFGFVKYKDPSNADDVLNGGPVLLNGKKVCQHCSHIHYILSPCSLTN